MAQGDDHQLVLDWYLEDTEGEAVLFSELPIVWDNALPETHNQIYLRGKMDCGLQKIHRAVVGWGFNFSSVVKPEIMVLSKDKSWIRVQNPRKCYLEFSRTIFTTLYLLHYLRWNIDASETLLWNQLSRSLCVFQIKPCENDLVDHRLLIEEVVKRYKVLRKSEILRKFIEEENPEKKKEKRDDSDDEVELVDLVCAICDDGGDVVRCDGKCLRSFHATKDDGKDSACQSLGFTRKQVEIMSEFFCENCKHEKHQCYVCGELGSSAMSCPEVYRCETVACGYFYHPDCIAKWLLRGDGDESAVDKYTKLIVKKIKEGKPFQCPIHFCSICRLPEDKKEKTMQMAVCRRCPRSYHRKCLPEEILFEGLARAWDNLPPDRIQIYCLDHDIVEDLRTPKRDHIKFPPTEERKKITTPAKKTSSSVD